MNTGVDHTAQDLDGLTAADLAEECGHMDCANFLHDYEPPPLPEIVVRQMHMHCRFCNVYGNISSD